MSNKSSHTKTFLFIYFHHCLKGWTGKKRKKEPTTKSKKERKKERGEEGTKKDIVGDIARRNFASGYNL